MQRLELVLDSRGDVVDRLIVSQLAAPKGHIDTTKQAGTAIRFYSAISLLNVQEAKVIGLVGSEGVQAALAAPAAPRLGAASSRAAIEHFRFVVLAKGA